MVSSRVDGCWGTWPAVPATALVPPHGAPGEERATGLWGRWQVVDARGWRHRKGPIVMSGCCGSYAPGHNAHQIQARLAGEDPHSWWPATVSAVDGDDATVDYGDGTPARLWRHAGFAGRLHVGEHVDVSERWSLLSVGGDAGARWLSVRVTPTGGRPIKPPREVAIRPVVHAGVVDIAAGEGLDIAQHRA